MGKILLTSRTRMCKLSAIGDRRPEWAGWPPIFPSPETKKPTIYSFERGRKKRKNMFRSDIAGADGSNAFSSVRTAARHGSRQCFLTVRRARKRKTRTAGNFLFYYNDE